MHERPSLYGVAAARSWDHTPRKLAVSRRDVVSSLFISRAAKKDALVTSKNEVR